MLVNPCLVNLCLFIDPLSSCMHVYHNLFNNAITIAYNSTMVNNGITSNIHAHHTAFDQLNTFVCRRGEA